MIFSDNLVRLRKSKGLSQEDLADSIGVSRQAISKWEVGISKPDMDNLIKLSKLFSITIDELVNNQVINTDAVSIGFNEENKKKKSLNWIRTILITLIVIYFINSIYKFSVLFVITIAEKKYQELNNYHYVIKKYDDEGLKEKEECWFKDGVSKTINTACNEGVIYENIMFVDSKEKKGYIIQENDKYSMDVSAYMNAIKNFENGGQFYSTLPQIFQDNSLNIILRETFKRNNIDMKIKEDCISIGLEEIYISFKRDNLQLLSTSYIDYETGKVTTTYYELELNSVESIEI